jgi:CsoR family transcriptional regulator, copper-sensing transcriptional repressor
MPAATTPVQRERRASLLDRLASAHGHLGAIRRMASEGHGCPEVVYQLRAVRSALVQVEQILVRQHLHHCLAEVGRGVDSDLLNEIVELWDYTPNPRGTAGSSR